MNADTNNTGLKVISLASLAPAPELPCSSSALSGRALPPPPALGQHCPPQGSGPVTAGRPPPACPVPQEGSGGCHCPPAPQLGLWTYALQKQGARQCLSAGKGGVGKSTWIWIIHDLTITLISFAAEAVPKACCTCPVCPHLVRNQRRQCRKCPTGSSFGRHACKVSG